MSEQNKVIHSNAYHAAVIERNPTAVRRFVAEPLADQLWAGCEAYLAAFPDLHVVVGEAIAEGDRVAARLVWTGTHDGDLPGIPATGRAIAIDSVDLVRIRDGKIVELWNLVDRQRMMEQLSGTPDASPTAPAARAEAVAGEPQSTTA